VLDDAYIQNNPRHVIELASDSSKRGPKRKTNMEESEVFVEPSSKILRLEESKEDEADKPLCLYGSSCFSRSPAHLKAYRHPKKNNYNLEHLPLCKYGAHCHDRNLLHFAMYYHPTSSDQSVERDKLNGNVNKKEKETQHSKLESSPVNECFVKENRSECVMKSEAVLSRGPSILKSYSLLTEEQKKDLIRTALETKQELKKKLNDTETILKSKSDELEMLRLKLDGNLLMVNGEEEAMRGDAIKYFPLYPKRKFREDSASDVHFRLAESQFYRLLPTGCPYKVTKVEYVVQPLLIKRFNEARKKIREVRGEECSYPVLGFHGTKEENIESICETGFRVPGEKSFQHASDPGWYGKGVYFSEYPRYSMNYIKDSKRLLLCQILPGNVFRCRYIIQGESLRAGFDSHMSPDRKEVVIFNSHHILPSYIVHYSVVQGDFYYETNE